MIQVNLLPGGKKRAGGKGKFSFALPKLGGGGGFSGISMPKMDRWILGAAAAVILALAAAGWLFMGVSGVAEELQVQIDGAASDSTRYASIIQRSNALQQRRDSIAARVDVIQAIDSRRYVWPHLMDEVGRAVPDYTWLTRFNQLVRGDVVTFRVEGQAGTYFAMTTLMENLEASPFIEAVSLVSSAQTEIPLGGGAVQIVYEFVLEGIESIPPPEILETVPLFDPSIVDPDAMELMAEPAPAGGG